MSAPTPTPWAVICPHHRRVFLTGEEYDEQLAAPDKRWKCTAPDGSSTRCGLVAEWDDEHHEGFLGESFAPPHNWSARSAGAELARIDNDTGQLLLPDEHGVMVESRDWGRLGRAVYQAITGKEPSP